MEVLQNPDGNYMNHQELLGNNWERAVIARGQYVPPRETARYTIVAQHLRGKKILEFGCSSGYGTQFYKIDGLNYYGIDKDPKIIQFARENFGAENINFECISIEDMIASMRKAYLGEPLVDTIVALEVMEHLSNGKELLQELKIYCKSLIATVPFNEPVGYWGEHHLLHGLQEEDFPNFDRLYLYDDGRISNEPSGEPTDLLLLRWFDPKYAVVYAEISTKGRLFDTLPLTLASLTQQTRPPQKVIIYDDDETFTDLRESSLYRHLFGLCHLKGIEVYVREGCRIGQVANHQLTLTNETAADIIWRIDDDNYAEPNLLEELLKNFDEKTGAVGSKVWHPDSRINKFSSHCKGKANLGVNFQGAEWFDFDDVKYQEHLYSTFIYNRWAGIKAGGYRMDLSPVGHHEETFFSHEIFRAGYQLKVIPSATMWHFRNPSGGIRKDTYEDMWKHDEQIYQDYLTKDCGYKLKATKFFVLNNGIGDHECFRAVLPEIIEKYGSEHEIAVISLHPELFEDFPVESVQFSAVIGLLPIKLEEHDIYKWMAERNWQNTVENAYRGMYL